MCGEPGIIGERKRSGVPHPTPEREACIEQADIREPGITQDGLVLLGRQNREFLTDACTSGLGLLWLDA